MLVNNEEQQPIGSGTEVVQPEPTGIQEPVVDSEQLRQQWEQDRSQWQTERAQFTKDLADLRKTFEESRKPAAPPEPTRIAPEEAARQFDSIVQESRDQVVRRWQSRFGRQELQQYNDYLGERVASGDYLTPILEIASDVATRLLLEQAQWQEQRMRQLFEDERKATEETARKTFESGASELQRGDFTNQSLADVERRLYETFPDVEQFISGLKPEGRRRMMSVIAGVADDVARGWRRDDGNAYENRAALVHDLYYHGLQDEINGYVASMGEALREMHGLTAPQPVKAPAAGPKRRPGAGPKPSGRAPVEEPEGDEAERSTLRAMSEMAGRGSS